MVASVENWPCGNSSRKFGQSWESLIWKVIGVDCQFFLENENYPMLRNIVTYSKRVRLGIKQTSLIRVRLLNKRTDCLIFDASCVGLPGG